MPNNILITPGSASIQFSGSVANTIRLQVEQSGSVAFYGASGSLFSIVDQMSGSLMSVNDVSGLPILEVFSDQRVVMGGFNQNALVVTGSRVGIDKANPQTDLDISGSVFITGSLRVSGGVTGSISTASFATTASFALNAGAGSGFPFSGSANITGSLFITGSGSNVFEVAGTQGTLFGVTDSLSGSLMNVNDVSGLPILEVFSDDRVVMGTFGRNTVVVTGSRVGVRKSAPATDLDVSGSVFITGSLGVTSGITGSISTASFAQTASFALNAGAGSGFPFSGSAIITGSLLISGSGTNFQVSGSASVRDNFTVNGSTLFVDAANNRVGIGTLVPAATLQVQGNISASSFTGSLFGTASLASNATTASFATTASQAINSNAALYSVTASWAANLASEIQRSIKTVEYFDTLTVFNGARRWWANTNFTIDKVSAFLIDPPQGASVNLRFNKNGVQASTLSIPAGSTYASGSPFILMNTQDYLTVDITQVGTSQAGGYLTIVFEYQ